MIVIHKFTAALYQGIIVGALHGSWQSPEANTKPPTPFSRTTPLGEAIRALLAPT